MSTVEQIEAQVRQLAPPQQERVLQFARSLTGNPSALPPGAKLEDLMKFAGTIPREDLEEMQRAIEEGCEQIDHDSW